MTRTWLTSTTAIALILHTVAPLPAFAEGELKANSKTELQDTATSTGFGENATLPTTANETAQTAADQAEAAAKAQAEAEAAQAAAEAQAKAEAEAAEAQAQAAKDAAAAEAAQAQADADAAAKAQADADAAAKAQAEADAAQAQADADAAAKAQAEADAAQAQADADAAAKAQAEADAAQAQADADAAAKAQADAAQAQADADAAAKAQAETDAAQAQADADAAAKAQEAAVAQALADRQAAEAAKEGSGQADAVAEVGESAQPLAPANAQAQAEAAQRAAEEAAQSAAAASGAEAVSTSEGTVTEEEARGSDEEFATTASGQQTAAAPAKKKDNDALKVIGGLAALGLGAYVVGRMMDDGGRVVSNTGDRAVIQDPDGAYRIIKDDDTLLRRPGSDVRTETFSDGSTRTVVTAQDGSRTVTIRAANGQVLRRARVLSDGREVTLFDDTQRYEPVDVTNLRPAQRPSDFDYSTAQVDDLRAALAASSGEAVTTRAYSLNQIRRIDAVRHLVPVIALDEINFETGSAVIRSAEAQALSVLGAAMRDAIDANPGQVFLIEGHTDTVGDARYNLALSDRRAESLALALTEYFDVPPANMVVQGYGEADLRVLREGDIRANRRGAVRNITPLLTGSDG
jgi:outer membrane protein OmpA-like peptidoglycan-associated protein